MRRPCTEMSQCFSAFLWCTSPMSLVCMRRLSHLCAPLQSSPYPTGLQSVNSFKLSSWSWQQTLVFYVGGHSRFTSCYFQSIFWGRCWRNSPILNLILEGHTFHWLQTHLPPYCLLLLHIPAPSCDFLPCSFSFHPDYPVYLYICSPLTSLSPPAFPSFALCIHMLELQVWHFFILGSNAQLERKSSWDCAGLEP